MDVKEKKDVNRIIIIGPIVGKFANGVATNITVRTPRINMPSNAKEGDACYNYPEIAFYGEDKAQINEAFLRGDIVRIEASIQSQRKTSPDGGRDHFEQKYVGTSIKKATPVLDGLVEGAGTYVIPENVVLLGGTISRIQAPSPGVCVINIRTFVDGRVNNVQSWRFGKIGDIMDRFRVGDHIAAVGTIQTYRKEVEGGPDQHYRRVVINDIVAG